MPRLRTIKPGFFTNEDLADLDPLACLLFAGLWCWADRAGRLEDRPRRLHVEIFPRRECDVDALLDLLAARGFIARYAVEGTRYIQIERFARHQSPHKLERASTIPPPCSNGACRVHAPDENRASPAGSGEWGGGSGESPSLTEETVGGKGGSRGGRAAGAATAAGAAGHPDPPEDVRGDDARSGTARLAPDLPRARPEDLSHPREARRSPPWTEPMRRIAARTEAEAVAAAEAAAAGAFDAGREETR